MEFTHKNHLVYTINGLPFEFRNSPFEKYNVSVGRVDLSYYQHNTWLSEQYRIGSLVTNNLGKDFVLLYSGVNSECILRILLSLNIKPILLFIRFMGDYNINEYYHAVRTATNLGITLTVFDYDIIGNYKSGELTEFADSFQCGNIVTAVNCHITNKLQRPTVIGHKTIFRKIIDLQKTTWTYDFPEMLNASTMRYSIKYKIPVISEWFAYTPESIAYFLDKIDLNSDIYKYKVSTNSIQNQIFCDMFPELTMTTHKSGYENLYGFATEFNLRGDSLHKGLGDNTHGIHIDELRKQLFGDTYVGH
jgi:hypothetical protein